MPERREDYSMQSSSLDHIRQEQIACAERYISDGNDGARLGMFDWFCEEFLIEQEGINALDPR